MMEKCKQISTQNTPICPYRWLSDLLGHQTHSRQVAHARDWLSRCVTLAGCG